MPRNLTSTPASSSELLYTCTCSGELQCIAAWFLNNHQQIHIDQSVVSTGNCLHNVNNNTKYELQHYSIIAYILTCIPPLVIHR